jgi:hypothetical protein
LIADDSLGAGIGSSSWEMTCVRGALPLWGLVDIGAGVVARVVGDERDVVIEGGRGDPGVGNTYGVSFATRAVGRLGPPEAQGAVEGIDDEVAQMLFHPGAAGLPPVTFQSQPVELGDRHERDHQEPTGQVGTVSLGARIAFEEIGHNVGVHDYCGG